MQYKKALSQHVGYYHFKIETFQSVVDLIRQRCFMASIDLRDVSYTVRVALNHRKFLKCWLKDKLHELTLLPNGPSHGPKEFAKLLKPVLASLQDCLLQ